MNVKLDELSRLYQHKDLIEAERRALNLAYNQKEIDLEEFKSKSKELETDYQETIKRLREAKTK